MNRIYMPGETICTQQEDNKSGRGTYLDGNEIKASIVGRLTLNQQEVQLISLFNEQEQPELKVGALIMGRVIRVKEDRTLVKVLKVDGKKFGGNLEGVLKKQNIRTHEVDKIRMDECFLPGDCIIARMISLGDSRTILLSTLEDGLGVMFAANKESGQLMIPISYDEMMCLQNGLREKRVVAKPDLSKYKAQ